MLSLIERVQEMRDLANILEGMTHSHSKVYALGHLLNVLREHLPDGPIGPADVQSLEGKKYVGQWVLEQLHELQADGECSYLSVLRARASVR